MFILVLIIIKRLALRSGHRVLRVVPYSRGIVKAEVEFKRERAGREGSKGNKAFYRHQKRRSTKRESDARKRVSGPR